MGRQVAKEPVEALMNATLEGFKHVNEAIKAVHQAQKVQAKATYSGLTGAGKARYVTELASSYNSQAQVAELLDLSKGRISQLVNSEKNKKNGR